VSAVSIESSVVYKGTFRVGDAQRVSESPTPAEDMRLMAAQLQRTPSVITPLKCASVAE
jgi:hypothetical protein